MLTRPGLWFWFCVAIGLAARVFCALATNGTEDVDTWTEHASGVAQQGLVLHYATDPLFNHPPAMAWTMARLWELSRSLGVDFGAAFRLLVGLVDLLSALLIFELLRASKWRWLAAAAYCLTPVATVLAACHGNTDALIAPCLLGCTLLAARQRPIATGALLGLSAWIKLPGLLAAPALGFAFPRWRDRVACALVALAVASSTYLWPFYEASRFALAHPEAVPDGQNLLWSRVFLYRGQFLRIDGTPMIWVWGVKGLFVHVFGWRALGWPNWALWWVTNSTSVTLPLMFLYGFLRRRDNSALGIAATIAGSFAIFYGLIESWAFQYFMWSLPFWMLAGWRFAVASNVLAGGYIYAFYAFASGDWFLRPSWRPLTSHDWPQPLVWLRDAALIAFLEFAATWFVRALAAEVGAWRKRWRGRGTADGNG